ncbi:MAG: NAD-dependent deacylase [Proteobacteria bacterium]|nr:NAD-dependent deacylase [Pseudomonadota bacterium]
MHPTLVILTGAGISAESGLATFRDSGGLWSGHRIEDVATPEAFARNPTLVHEFYNKRRAQLAEASPNAAHLALAELAQRWPGRFLLVTQNVDNLHEQALEGRTPANGFVLKHMHGELTKARCLVTEQVHDWHDAMDTTTPCPCCNRAGWLRPHIVWFGEMPLYMDLIAHMLSECDLFISIGTSGNVYPAAGFVQQARMNGRARTIELNMEPSSGHSLFHETHYGPATQIVPHYVRQMLDAA